MNSYQVFAHLFGCFASKMAMAFCQKTEFSYKNPPQQQRKLLFDLFLPSLCRSHIGNFVYWCWRKNMLNCIFDCRAFSDGSNLRKHKKIHLKNDAASVLTVHKPAELSSSSAEPQLAIISNDLIPVVKADGDLKNMPLPVSWSYFLPLIIPIQKLLTKYLYFFLNISDYVVFLYLLDSSF